MEFVIEYTSLHNDGDYIYPDMGDVTIHASDRSGAIKQFHEMYPSSTFISYHIDAVHLIPHQVENQTHHIVKGTNGGFSIKPINSDGNYLTNVIGDHDLVAIALTESDAELVCDALNAYSKKIDISSGEDSGQLNLFEDTD